jgi:hypothetical protein
MTDGEVAETDVVLLRETNVGDILPPLLIAEARDDSEDMAEDVLANGCVDG